VPGFVQSYVDRVCAKLAPHVEVTIAADASARAGALAGGPVTVTTGLIAGAATEAELAGILAHEIAHSEMREHPLGESDAESGICLRFAAGEANFEGARAWEHDADQAAISLLTKAGYNPLAMLRYFSRLRHASPDLPRAFSAEDVLIERLQLEATDHPMKDPVEDTPEFQAVRERLK
jgi:predicted Zn-dependent protease